MKETILNHEHIKNSITKNDGKDDVKYRWSHGATDKHLGDGMLVYSLMYYFKPKLSVRKWWWIYSKNNVELYI